MDAAVVAVKSEAGALLLFVVFLLQLLVEVLLTLLLIAPPPLAEEVDIANGSCVYCTRYVCCTYAFLAPMKLYNICTGVSTFGMSTQN